MFKILAVGKLRQKDQEFKGRLCYTDPVPTTSQEKRRKKGGRRGRKRESKEGGKESAV